MIKRASAGIALGIALLTGGAMASFCHAENLNLDVPGPDFAAEAKRYADAPPPQTPDRPLIHIPTETRGFDVHGGVSAGVMAGSHHTSGQYTSGHVDLSRGNTQLSFGASQMTMHGRGYGPYYGPGRYDSSGFAASWAP